MRLYIAGPMTGIEALNFPLFHATAAKLRALGHDIVNPAEINADPSSGWAECLKKDIAELLSCEGVVLLSGWSQSKGAKLEAHIAHQLGMHLFDPRDLGVEP